MGRRTRFEWAAPGRVTAATRAASSRRCFGGPAEVTLRLPPPLATPLQVGRRAAARRRERGRGGATRRGRRRAAARGVVRRGGGGGRRGTTRASTTTRFFHVLRVQPRAAPTTASIFAAAVRGRRRRRGAMGPRRRRPREFVWAALDCPGAIAVGWDARGVSCSGGWRPRCVDCRESASAASVVAQPRGEDGRKLYAATALYGEDGRLLARAVQTWIVPERTSDSLLLSSFRGVA